MAMAVIAMATASCAETPAPTGETGREAEPREGVLTEEQIDAFQTSVEGSRRDVRFTFSAAFGPRRLNDRDRRRYSSSGAVPFHITANYNEERTSGRRVLRRTASGRVNFYVLDAEGTIVARSAMPSDRMCPT